MCRHKKGSTRLSRDENTIHTSSYANEETHHHYLTTKMKNLSPISIILLLQHFHTKTSSAFFSNNDIGTLMGLLPAKIKLLMVDDAPNNFFIAGHRSEITTQVYYDLNTAEVTCCIIIHFYVINYTPPYTV